MRQDQNRFVPQVANDLGADDGFAGAGRGHQDVRLRPAATVSWNSAMTPC
jgi:hypothetical protein